MTLEELNGLPGAHAETELLKCCGSTCWARSMASVRPFRSVEEIFQKAEELCGSLSAQDWLEAFRAHPKIGEKQTTGPQSAEARRWSEQEQSGVQAAAAETMAALAAGNRDYEQRFGFIFIVCASGKTSEEMLTILNDRLRNDRATELRIAAEEQRKITRLRLEKLLEE